MDLTVMDSINSNRRRSTKARNKIEDKETKVRHVINISHWRSLSRWFRTRKEREKNTYQWLHQNSIHLRPLFHQYVSLFMEAIELWILLVRKKCIISFKILRKLSTSFSLGDTLQPWSVVFFLFHSKRPKNWSNFYVFVLFLCMWIKHARAYLCVRMMIMSSD